ncbi:peptide chain release factor N(5)-glutamine methyltransferase [Maribacter dokdonensis]|uniref:peptide chain release factor N(5)-glutamine methyltransferase n=1 Tax=Maribacter dokdonensis TaxID=320912 RepID=UPI00273484A7|nr:peptide chain release factor N(5)-glutamine methyltransferase [Maribacter dokdonensis]MDP2524692.1 peptide chain release factor N(5)-glutamine methyltransferase [Maribacter dokdonensis]
MLLKEVKNIFHAELDVIYGKDEVNSFFYLLIEHYFELERFVLALQPNLNIEKEQETILFKALSELKLHKPIQHITGTAYFMDLDFTVNEHVLIPRPETEELVRWVLDDVKEVKHFLNILDMGTGSGCIPISLDKNLVDAKVYALDVSPQALVVAEENNRTLGANVTFVKEDMLSLHSKTSAKELDQKFDIIISNPPYVRELEKAEMQNNVIDHEPSLALFVPDEDPLKFYKAVVNFASEHLNKNGCLYLEINQYLGEETKRILQQSNFKTIDLRPDMFGNDRMIKGIRK